MESPPPPAPHGTDDVQIRQAVPADLPDIAPLFDAYRQFQGQPSDPGAALDFIRARMDHGDGTLILARHAGRPAGFTQLFPSHSSVSLRRVVILNDLYVAPHARRLGVARRLLAASLAHARALGAARLSLNTAVDNRAAQSAFAAMGWRPDEQFIAYHVYLDATS